MSDLEGDLKALLSVSNSWPVWPRIAINDTQYKTYCAMCVRARARVHMRVVSLYSIVWFLTVNFIGDNVMLQHQTHPSKHFTTACSRGGWDTGIGRV